MTITPEEAADRVEAMFDQDDGYREWAETIEKQNQEAQDLEMQFENVIDLTDMTMPQAIRALFKRFQ